MGKNVHVKTEKKKHKNETTASPGSGLLDDFRFTNPFFLIRQICILKIVLLLPALAEYLRGLVSPEYAKVAGSISGQGTCKKQPMNV